jgi:hypothetical protein
MCLLYLCTCHTYLGIKRFDLNLFFQLHLVLAMELTSVNVFWETPDKLNSLNILTKMEVNQTRWLARSNVSLIRFEEFIYGRYTLSCYIPFAFVEYGKDGQNSILNVSEIFVFIFCNTVLWTIFFILYVHTGWPDELVKNCLKCRPTHFLSKLHNTS